QALGPALGPFARHAHGPLEGAAFGGVHQHQVLAVGARTVDRASVGGLADQVGFLQHVDPVHAAAGVGPQGLTAEAPAVAEERGHVPVAEVHLALDADGELPDRRDLEARVDGVGVAGAGVGAG